MGIFLGLTPFIAFFMFESTHMPYDFDEATAPFEPYARYMGFAQVSEARRARIVNRYHDAVHYVDGLVGQVLRSLVRNGLADDTIVIVTGDHGEEFHEHGFWGHATGFTPEQVRVPLVLYVPGMPPRRYDDVTSHVDLPPTVLGLLGVRNPPSDYGVGRSLFDGRPTTAAVSCDDEECALVEPEDTVTFGVGTADLAGVELRDSEYRRIHASKATLRARSTQVLDLMARTRDFLQ